MGTIITKPKEIILSFFISGIFFLITAVGIAQTGVGINTTNPRSDFEVNGSFAKKVIHTTSGITLNKTHSIVVCNNAATEITITLPLLSGCIGRIYTIKKGSSTANVIIDASGTETIGGALTYVLADVKAAVTLINDGMEWKEYGRHVALFPMGEVSYFNTTGTNVVINNQTTDGGITNMVVCRPPSTFLNRGEFDNGGADNGRIKYIGKNTKTFHVGCTISGSVPAANKTLVFGIAKNGTVQSNSKVLNIFSNNDTQSTSLHVMLSLAPDDYLDFYVGNTTGSEDFTFKTFNLVAIGMPD